MRQSIYIFKETSIEDFQNPLAAESALRNLGLEEKWYGPLFARTGKVSNEIT